MLTPRATIGLYDPFVFDISFGRLHITLTALSLALDGPMGRRS